MVIVLTPNKLLIDPYARELVSIFSGTMHFAYQLLLTIKISSSLMTVIAAPFTPKRRVIDPMRLTGVIDNGLHTVVERHYL